ncbi:hypothetical protein J8L98_19890 [Pseudoalteromonas sp. MMG013]|uniref:hypothetical protein n=1 Tax=Pseudoalteromonas sp. MMG013 TaxID=2822687 RepID=UPI001B3689E7|nr:hypothetical protein [Pseudoalteromonas sp. MMG013]MBQ4863953.1 hypothetical protein [Pseudoalteromonas sp. MMG013]
MKIKAIAAVIAVSIIGYLGLSSKEVALTNEAVTSTSTTAVALEDIELTTSKEIAKPVGIKSREKGAQVGVEQEPNVQDIVQNAIDIDTSEEDKYYDFIIENFPELTEDVNTYRHAIKEQRQKVSVFSAHMSERNKQVSLSKNIDSGADSALKEQQDILLAQARVLGQQAMALNQAIREAAYNK